MAGRTPKERNRWDSVVRSFPKSIESARPARAGKERGPGLRVTTSFTKSSLGARPARSGEGTHRKKGRMFVMLASFTKCSFRHV